MHKELVLFPGARTPFGSFGGSLRDHSPRDLGVLASKTALERSGVLPLRIDHTIFGNALQTDGQDIYLARHIGLNAGVPLHIPALTVNRLCASGFQSIISGAHQILLDEADFVLAGGVESMSRAPYLVKGARWGVHFGDGTLEDALCQALEDSNCGCKMGSTAENLANRYGITRQEVDEFAYRSQMALKSAVQGCSLSDEIVPVEIKGKRGETSLLVKDEHPRSDTTLEGLSKLKSVFKEDGVVTAGNASGICDGAAALVMGSGEIAKKEKLEPIGRLISWGIAGCEPEIMGIGPVPASKIALERAGLSLDDMDLIEINEAFACQYLAVERELGLDREKVNVNGGAIALGHPLGASGTRLIITLLYQLRRTGAKYGLASACVGGGQGVALVVEAF